LNFVPALGTPASATPFLPEGQQLCWSACKSVNVFFGQANLSFIFEIVFTSGFQKKTEQTRPAEITRAEQLRKLWMRYHNRCAVSQKEREAILKELGSAEVRLTIPITFRHNHVASAAALRSPERSRRN
jgi:hypothetical protein